MFSFGSEYILELKTKTIITLIRQINSLFFILFFLESPNEDKVHRLN